MKEIEEIKISKLIFKGCLEVTKENKEQLIGKYVIKDIFQLVKELDNYYVTKFNK